MLNCGLGLLLIPAAGIYLLARGGGIADAFALSEDFSAAPVLAAAICALTSMVNIAAPSVSLEGKSLWILSTLPIKPWQVIKSKLSVHIILTILPVIFTDFCGTIALRLSFAEAVLVFAVTLLYVFVLAFFNMMLGMRNPDFNWSSEIIPIKQSFAAFASSFGGLIVGAAVGVVYFTCHIGSVAYLCIVSAVFAILAEVLFRFLYVYGPRKFLYYQ